MKLSMRGVTDLHTDKLQDKFSSRSYTADGYRFTGQRPNPCGGAVVAPRAWLVVDDSASAYIPRFRQSMQMQIACMMQTTRVLCSRSYNSAHLWVTCSHELCCSLEAFAPDCKLSCAIHCKIHRETTLLHRHAPRASLLD